MDCLTKYFCGACKRPVISPIFYSLHGISKSTAIGVDDRRGMLGIPLKSTLHMHQAQLDQKPCLYWILLR